MPLIKTRVEGVKELAAKLNRAKLRFAPMAMSALFEETKIELREVVQRTPRRTGDLRASEHIDGPHQDGIRIWCDIVASKDYAFIVHEDEEAIHPIGQAHYISSVLDESAPHMMERVGHRIDMDRLFSY